MVDEAGRDVDDVAAALYEHLLDCALGDVEETGEVDGNNGVEVVWWVVGERLADEDAGVADQRVDPPETVECLVRHAMSGFRLRDVTRHRDDVGFAAGRCIASSANAGWLLRTAASTSRGSDQVENASACGCAAPRCAASQAS
jgi:hypothetical protein